jgi:alginate O-acetyltransferase complex protein AlgI
MLFNSIDFALFLPLVFVIFWAIPAQQMKARNWVILVSSYIFYGWWDVRFLALIAFSTLLDYFIGRGMAEATDERRRKLLLWTSLSVNLGLLGFFKYFNFFLDQLNGAFTLFGMDIHAGHLDIILPVGISFYTFQTLSYSIDVYRGNLQPSRDPVAFAAFVSFFPQLVAGPIERASNLLPQFATPRVFSRSAAVDGSRQILWGFFKKLVIADNCAEQVDIIFSAHGTHGGSTLLLGAVLFAFQIYGDFSGYSDIAIGVSRLFGFTLMRNFAFPYFSRDIAEFWRRWHISLSTWFRDYLYVPLGGSRGGTAMRVRNTFIIFLVSGFWHGANWTFVIWGALNAVYFLPLLLAKRNRQNLGMVAEGRLLPSPREAMQVLLTFALTCVAWVFFRALNVEQAMDYLAGMVSSSLLHPPHLGNSNLYLLLPIFVGIEWWGRHGEHALERVALGWSRGLRWTFYGVLIGCIGLFMRTDEAPFIYFQF